MNSGKARSSLIGVVGGYLLYLAWDLFQGRTNPDSTMSPAVLIVFVLFFCVMGILLLIYAVRLWRRSLEEDAHEKEDETSLK